MAVMPKDFKAWGPFGFEPLEPLEPLDMHPPDGYVVTSNKEMSMNLKSEAQYAETHYFTCKICDATHTYDSREASPCAEYNRYPTELAAKQGAMACFAACAGATEDGLRTAIREALEIGLPTARVLEIIDQELGPEGTDEPL